VLTVGKRSLLTEETDFRYGLLFSSVSHSLGSENMLSLIVLEDVLDLRLI